MAGANAHHGGGSGLLGAAVGFLAAAASGGAGPKFSKVDVKRVYFVGAFILISSSFLLTSESG